MRLLTALVGALIARACPVPSAPPGTGMPPPLTLWPSPLRLLLIALRGVVQFPDGAVVARRSPVCPDVVDVWLVPPAGVRNVPKMP